MVTWAENTWYTWHAPPKGGKPQAGGHPPAVPDHPHRARRPGPLPAPAAIVPFVTDPTPGEGQWHPIGRDVDGVPAMYAAYLRPNAVNTSLVTGVAWMDTNLLRAKLYAGDVDPRDRTAVDRRGPRGRRRPSTRWRPPSTRASACRTPRAASTSTA